MMRLFRMVATIAGAVCAATLLPAQVRLQPGQLASAPRIEIGSPQDAAGSASGSMPKTSIAAVDEGPHDAFMNRLWITSMCALVAGTSLDAATSWGKTEGNSLLASSNGTFGAKGLGIKAGMAAAVLVPQIFLRKHKDLKGVFIMGNFGEAAIFSGAAVHNLGVQSAATVK